MDTQSFGAIVVGAGIGGATAAAHLSAYRRVALLEAEEQAGFHTTGRSAAIWAPNYGTPDARVLTLASRAFFEAPPEGFTAVPLFRQRDVVLLATAEDRPLLDALLGSGTAARPVPLEAVRARVPALRPGYAAAAAVDPDHFDMDVAALHGGFLRQLASRGGVLSTRARAGRLWRDAGEWHAETASGAVFRAPVLVNAAGAWGDEVAGLAGVDRLGLQPKRRTAVIVDPSPHDVADWPTLMDVGESWYARPEARSRLMVSPADETDDVPGDAQAEELDVAIAVDRMQAALDLPVRRVEHRWAGLRTFTPDRGLAIGPGSEPGFWWNCGQGGYGIQTAPAAGRLLAALVAGEDPGPLAAVVPLVDPRRFAEP